MSSKRSRNKAGSPVPRQQSPQRRPAPQPAKSSGAAQAPVAEENGGSPNVILIVVIVTALFMGWYYHLSSMSQMRDLVGQTMLDHRWAGYSAADVDSLRQAMDSAARGQLSWVHKTAGTIFAIVVALATSLSIGLHGPKTAWRKALFALPIVFALVAITHNIVVDQLLGAPDDALAGLASALTTASGILLALCILLVIYCLVSSFVREFRRRWNDPTLQEPGAR
ncbi:hypothetical protein [Galactobacter caseinivorans]|uniref:Uncharacterized protein n=1 Tax=Galactobacter caseinivorans TaxID=2676123 RepID=A0A496PG97_9MICC|nr:hypothetical protein [Galactobacter caseinivorans]RKW69448.1 hypothetical protein DWQ67_12910 [Galactobacter caseinivorans]